MKKNIFSAIAIAAAMTGFVSCTSYLDMTPSDRVSEKTIWAETETAEYSINYLYTYIWDVNASPTVIGLTEALTDQLKYTSYNYNALCYIPSEMSYGGSVLTAGYVDSYMGYWGTLYVALRRVNADLNYLHNYGQMSDADKARLEGELRFLRAYTYFELLKRYKEVIIYDEDLTAITKDKAVGTESDGWDMVQKDLQFASENLPAPSAAKGRIDKGMALAMMTRTMLYAKRYDAVIKAATDLEATQWYGLEANYADATTKTLAAGNKEAILQYTFDLANGLTHSFNFYYTPGGDYTVNSATGGGYGVPTQEMVESYELAAGGFPDWTPWHGDATTQTPPYELLEPRFKATILYNGAAWKGRKIEPFVNGTDGWATWCTDKEPKGRTVTGYYLRKLVDENYDVNTSGSSQPFTFLRYAEVLLNKAEACAMSNQADAANEVLKVIRGRVGLPFTSKTGDELISAIKQERKVELAYEGLLYWDLRRWGDADKAYPVGLNAYQQHGFKIEKSGDAFKYTYVSVDDKDRNFPAKMYRFPMPESELNSNSLVNQYPEWK